MAKELRLYNGGHPITNDDAVLLQDNAFEGLSDIVKGMLPNGTNRAILYGCNITTGGGSTNISAGAIYYDGKIYRVDAQSITTSPSIWFVIEEVIGSFDPVIYADTIPHNVHFTLKMKMQSGSGLFLITDIFCITETFQSLLDFSTFATTTYVNNLFATLRNGYDPTFRVSPTTGILEWAYKSPSHPITEGLTGNEWQSLGIVIGAVNLGTLGIFEARITIPVYLPVGYLTGAIPPPAGHTNAIDVILFDTEVFDDGNNFSLMRRFVAPINGSYNFIVDNQEIECVSTTVPFPATVQGHWVALNFGIYKNGILIDNIYSVNLNSGGNTTGANPMLLGQVIPIASRNITETLNANDEITLRWYLYGDSLNPYASDIILYRRQIAANARVAYRLRRTNFYTI